MNRNIQDVIKEDIQRAENALTQAKETLKQDRTYADGRKAQLAQSRQIEKFINGILDGEPGAPLLKTYAPLMQNAYIVSAYVWPAVLQADRADLATLLVKNEKMPQGLIYKASDNDAFGVMAVLLDLPSSAVKDKSDLSPRNLTGTFNKLCARDKNILPSEKKLALVKQFEKLGVDPSLSMTNYLGYDGTPLEYAVSSAAIARDAAVFDYLVDALRRKGDLETLSISLQWAERGLQEQISKGGKTAGDAARFLVEKVTPAALDIPKERRKAIPAPAPRYDSGTANRDFFGIH